MLKVIGYKSLDELAVALGPQGANSEGALSELISTTAENFEGQGEQFNQTIKDLGRLTGTLENNKDELFGSYLSHRLAAGAQTAPDISGEPDWSWRRLAPVRWIHSRCR